MITPRREQWAHLTPHQRALVRARLTPEQTAELAPRIANTPKFNLPYPDDYNDPADSPNALQDLAEATDTALGLMTVRTPLPFRGYEKDNPDVPLTADAKNVIGWGSGFQLSTTIPAVDSANGIILDVIRAGVYLIELETTVIHGTSGTERNFALALDWISGSNGSGEWSVPLVAKQLTSSWGVRLPLRTVRYLAAGDTFQATVRPVGSTATGWTMTYARLQLTQMR